MKHEHEIDVIADMVKAAKNEDMLIEVIWSFAQNCINEKPITIDEWQKCANTALFEWDI